MRCIAVFDFDGTLTRVDSMLAFIKYSRGSVILILGLLLFSPLLILTKLGIYPNSSAKQRFFSFFFQGCPYEIFRKSGVSFMSILDSHIKRKTLKKVFDHLSKGDTVYVVTASIEEWVVPWCRSKGINNIIGTKVEVKNGKLTGRFLSKNCFGIEKVNRLLEIEPDRQAYNLFAYGDSRGDREIIEFADYGIYV